MPKKRDKGDGCVRERSDERFEARLITGKDAKGKNIVRTFYGKSRQEVLNKIRAVKLEVDTNTYVEPSKMSLETWLQKWLLDKN